MKCFDVRGGALLAATLAGVGLGCDDRDEKSAPTVTIQPKAQETKATALKGEDPLLNPPNASEGAVPPAVCPTGMAQIPAGEFWVGTEREVYEREENPQFKARVAQFCVDRLEVATSEYENCVRAGKCTAPHSGSKTCNSVKKDKGDHPMNCIDHSQARAVCAARGARLPTEIEWEYLARGGEEMRTYPWGEAEPDERTCWKHSGTCKRGSYAEEAFGLHDVVGNVWEWTDSWFGPYPWPSKDGRHKVYRGGSWSRRFAKWMRPTLRNRQDPKDSGSHLGVRCALTLPGEECGGEPTEAGGCQHQILEVKCLDKHQWNGVRCARPGDARKCLPPAEEEPGYGCVAPKSNGAAHLTLDLSEVTRTRSPEFDSDCGANSPTRPVAYRYSGGAHLARNAVGRDHGCKNRDVGVGFNSACCPK